MRYWLMKSEPDEASIDHALAAPENPRWLLVDVRALNKTRLIPLPELRSHPELETMQILRRGNRLSITPVSREEWEFIVERLVKGA